MANKPQKIILDTNLWISFLITNDFDKLTQLLVSGGVQLIFSTELLEEFLEVVNRPKFQKYFSNTSLTAIMRHIKSYAQFIEVTSIITLCRDAKDNFLLALAEDGSADFLLTGDKDLLVIGNYKGCKIITIANFYNQINA